MPGVRCPPVRNRPDCAQPHAGHCRPGRKRDRWPARQQGVLDVLCPRHALPCARAPRGSVAGCAGSSRAPTARGWRLVPGPKHPQRRPRLWRAPRARGASPSPSSRPCRRSVARPRSARPESACPLRVGRVFQLHQRVGVDPGYASRQSVSKPLRVSVDRLVEQRRAPKRLARFPAPPPSGPYRPAPGCPGSRSKARGPRSSRADLLGLSPRPARFSAKPSCSCTITAERNGADISSTRSIILCQSLTARYERRSITTPDSTASSRPSDCAHGVDRILASSVLVQLGLLRLRVGDLVAEDVGPIARHLERFEAVQKLEQRAVLGPLRAALLEQLPEPRRLPRRRGWPSAPST